MQRHTSLHRASLLCPSKAMQWDEHEPKEFWVRESQCGCSDFPRDMLSVFGLIIKKNTQHLCDNMETVPSFSQKKAVRRPLLSQVAGRPGVSRTAHTFRLGFDENSLQSQPGGAFSCCKITGCFPVATGTRGSRATLVCVYEKWPDALKRGLVLSLWPPTLWVSQGRGEIRRTYFGLPFYARLNASHFSKRYLTFPFSRAS